MRSNMMNKTNNFLRKLMHFTPSQLRTLVILVTLTSLCALAAAGFSRSYIREVAPRLLDHSTSAADVPNTSAPLINNKHNAPEPAARNAISSTSRSSDTTQNSEATVVPVNPVKPKIFHG